MLSFFSNRPGIPNPSLASSKSACSAPSMWVLVYLTSGFRVAWYCCCSGCLVLLTCKCWYFLGEAFLLITHESHRQHRNGFCKIGMSFRTGSSRCLKNLSHLVFSLAPALRATRLLRLVEQWSRIVDLPVEPTTAKRWVPFDRILPFRAVLDGDFPLPRDPDRHNVW
jgi:hypothetical protein